MGPETTIVAGTIILATGVVVFEIILGSVFGYVKYLSPLQETCDV